MMVENRIWNCKNQVFMYVYLSLVVGFVGLNICFIATIISCKEILYLSSVFNFKNILLFLKFYFRPRHNGT